MTTAITANLKDQLIESLDKVDPTVIDNLDLFNGAKIDLMPEWYLVIKSDGDDINPTRLLPGEFKWARNNDQRPSNFTGAAIKIKRDRYDCLWWEPERDNDKVYNDEETIKYVERALEYGFAYVSVVLRGPAKDAFNQQHTVDIISDSVCRVDWESVKEVAHELVGNIAHQIKQLDIQ